MTKEQMTIFDLDGTVFHGPSTVWGLKSLARAKLLHQHRELLEQLDTLNNPQGDQVPHISLAGRILGRVISDIPEHALRRNAEEAAQIWREEWVFPEMEEEIDKAQKRGRVIVVSHGPDAFIRPFARLIGAEHALGRMPEDFIARRKPEKLQMTATVCKAAGISFDWNDPGWESTVYGDDKNDVPLLQMATRPVLVNPRPQELRDMGLAEGWRILDCQNSNRYGEYGYLEGAFLADSH